MSKKETISVQGTEITVIVSGSEDYISLTDMAGYKDELEARVVVSNWMSTRFTLEFLGIWEQIYNPNFNRMEFHTVKNADGRLVLTPKRWVERTKQFEDGSFSIGQECKSLSVCAETVLQGFKPLSEFSETVLQGFKPLSEFSETVLQGFKPLSEFSETVLQGFKPLSEFSETVLQGCKPLSADPEAMDTRINTIYMTKRKHLQIRNSYETSTRFWSGVWLHFSIDMLSLTGKQHKLPPLLLICFPYRKSMDECSKHFMRALPVRASISIESIQKVSTSLRRRFISIAHVFPIVSLTGKQMIRAKHSVHTLPVRASISIESIQKISTSIHNKFIK